MTDNLIVAVFVLIFLQEIRRAGKGDLVDVLFHLVGRHADAVIRDYDGLFFVVQDHVHTGLPTFGESVIPHGIHLFQLGYGVAGI